jgi:hypothetical protein
MSTGDAGADSSARAALVNRIWNRAGAAAPLGSFVLFLEGGTLVQDSCWETYRLSRWTLEAGDTLRWNEDGADIGATVVDVGERSLVLRLQLVGGTEERRYVAAAAPYVCPDLPR